MRKDVENLSMLFPSRDATAGNALDMLRWPAKPADLAMRYEVLLSGVDFDLYSPQRPLRLLDLGCGLGLLLDYLDRNGLLDRVDYTGLDLVDPILEKARERWPGHRFENRDVRDTPFPGNSFDYCIICGIFTVKHGNTYEETLALAQETLKSVWPSVKHGLSFNSMSKHVDWEREDLFHWPLDEIMAFCKRDLSRHVSFRLDYGLWEGSTLVRKEAVPRCHEVPADW
jgi:SAM-dependent methyltransferase